MMTADSQLLDRYLREKSQAAFAELVRRHLDLVYSAALRQVRSPQLAEEISQSVFTDLARDAHKLKPDTVLTAWLYQVARRTAIDVVRSESRRQARERLAVEMAAMNSASDWTQIEPLLDDAMDALEETDRAAVLLRYFDNKSLREVGQALGTSDDAAQKRVSRAVERLREFFSQRGISIGAAALIVVISANAVHAAPAGLAAAISTATVFAATTVQTSTAIAATKAIAMTTLQKVIVTSAIAVLAGTGIYEAHQASQLHAQVRALQQQQAPLTGQIRQLQQERDDADNRIASANTDNNNANNSELLKLRAEVTSLRQQLPSARVALLKQKFDAMPDKKIPELQFLTDKDWQKVASDADLDTDDGVRVAMRDLRDKATDKFMNLMRTALKSYIASHDGMLPPSLLDLTSYFQEPVTDEMLQHYQLVQSGTLSTDWSQTLVKKTVRVDSEYDSNQEMSMSGGGGGSWNTVERAVELAAGSYSADHAGQLPTDPSQLAPYLKSPLDTATEQKYLAQMNSDPPPPEIVPLMPALRAYANAHNGQYPQSPSALQDYVTTDKEKAALDQAMKIYAASQHSTP
ncbi:MAG TPA: sigma-70 family RNA polymerase sigma factor [Verrucomicrobiae bacterium]|nr:sigma-70 family RNA polymerase sigma factor [Verrucomicrobiae bacterium]